jgi:hypothetical protein
MVVRMKERERVIGEVKSVVMRFMVLIRNPAVVLLISDEGSTTPPI